MAIVALVAGYLGRPTDGCASSCSRPPRCCSPTRSCAPVGFLLSCAASLGIALLARPIADRLRGPAWMREVLGVTAAAQLGVAPVLIPVFGSMPLVALPGQPRRGPARRAAHDVGARRGRRRRVGPPAVARRSRACWSSPPSVCCTR